MCVCQIGGFAVLCVIGEQQPTSCAVADEGTRSFAALGWGEVVSCHPAISCQTRLITQASLRASPNHPFCHVCFGCWASYSLLVREASDHWLSECCAKETEGPGPSATWMLPGSAHWDLKQDTQVLVHLLPCLRRCWCLPLLRAFLSCRDPSSSRVHNLSLIISAASNHNGCVVRVMARASPPEANAPALHLCRQCVWARQGAASAHQSPGCGLGAAASLPPPDGRPRVLPRSSTAQMAFQKLLWPLTFSSFPSFYISLLLAPSFLDGKRHRGNSSCFLSWQQISSLARCALAWFRACWALAPHRAVTARQLARALLRGVVRDSDTTTQNGGAERPERLLVGLGICTALLELAPEVKAAGGAPGFNFERVLTGTDQHLKVTWGIFTVLYRALLRAVSWEMWQSSGERLLQHLHREGVKILMGRSLCCQWERPRVSKEGQWQSFQGRGLRTAR